MTDTNKITYAIVATTIETDNPYFHIIGENIVTAVKYAQELKDDFTNVKILRITDIMDV